jgi:predicted ArsR family transcriptional regulator
MVPLCYSWGARKEQQLAHWDEKFFESTRGQMVTLLRRGGLTVEDLAQAFGLTGNGVRAHLAVLERDGTVRRRGVVRRESGGGKPAQVYELTPEAEEMFPRAYQPVLLGLLDVLAERLGREKSESLLREAGGRMAAGIEVPADGIRGRLAAAVAVLNELGGLAELEERDGTFVIRSYGCPLATVVPGHPEMCALVETLIAEMTCARIREHCDRGESPRCCFEATY